MFLDGAISFTMFLFLISACFFAGFIDSVAGGGGLISLPVYSLSGMPMHMAYGCNKFSATFGTTLATYRYYKNNMIDLPIGISAALGAFLTSGLAARLVLYLSDATLQAMMAIILPIAAIITLMNKNMGIKDHSHELPQKKKMILGFLVGIALGFYDGILGPGTGTFAIMGFCLVLKYSMNTASGNAKCLNLASNYSALFVFLLDGAVYFPIAIPCAITGIIGNYLGSGFAIRYGASGIRKILIFVLLLLFIKMGIEFLF